MALVLKDRVKVTSITTGTGTFTLGSAVAGFQDFSVVGDANTTFYTITYAVTGDWEVGIGTYTASGTTLSRDTVLESSNAGSLVDFGVGEKIVFVTYPAERAVWANAVPTVITYTSPDTYGSLATKIENGLKSIKVTVVGGGGGGGGQRGTAPPSTVVRAAGGGGGGGAAIEYIPAADLAPVVPTGVTVTVGSGGAGGPTSPAAATATSGSSGGTTSFGAFCSATGGGGFLAPNLDGGIGGVGSGGNINIKGGGGMSASVNPVSVDYGATGGSSFMGGGAYAMYNNGAGQAGGNYGGGGGGAISPVSTSNNAGGAGAGGIVIVEEFY